MMYPKSITLALCLLLSTSSATKDAAQEQRKLFGDLESYMSSTSSVSVTMPPTAPLVATGAPSQPKTFVPSASPSVKATPGPTQSPTKAATGAPTQATVTDAPTQATVTDAPIEAQTVEQNDGLEAPAEATSNPEVTNTNTTEAQTEELYAMVIDNGYGQVSLDFSLYSPYVPINEMNFMKLKEGINVSMDVLICDESNEGVEGRGPEFCAVRQSIVDEDALEAVGDQGDKTTILQFAMTSVKEETACTEDGKEFGWTTWNLGWDVIQVGTTLQERVLANHTGDESLTHDEIYDEAVIMLQGMIQEGFEAFLRDGLLEHHMNVYMEDVWILTSFVGQEVYKFYNHVPEQVERSKEGTKCYVPGLDEGGDEMLLILIAFGGGLGIVVVLVFLHASCKGKETAIQPKRVVVVRDDASKSLTGFTAQSSGMSTGMSVTSRSVSSGNTQQHVYQQPGPSGAQDPSELIKQLRSSYVANPPVARKPATQQPVARKPVTQQPVPQEQPQQSNTSKAASKAKPDEVKQEIVVDVGDALDMKAVDVDDMVDVENQNAEAYMAPSMGTMAAMTGVSGLDHSIHSDTWSVGSMSIDLAEWS